MQLWNQNYDHCEQNGQSFNPKVDSHFFIFQRTHIENIERDCSVFSKHRPNQKYELGIFIGGGNENNLLPNESDK